MNEIDGIEIGPGKDLRGIDLSNQTLSGRNLAGANLQGATLENSNLDGALLAGINLKGANLKNASFRGADLAGVNMEGANTQGADFTDANMRGVRSQTMKLIETKNPNNGGVMGAFIGAVLGISVGDHSPSSDVTTIMYIIIGFFLGRWYIKRQNRKTGGKGNE
ncbi:pentapeptide repeat-containing protein [Candidatus Pacearchaeota archaeon]|nr:pentapeptide repeat-containing protein [Candidatus Pacearchaeota archaeon]